MRRHLRTTTRLLAALAVGVAGLVVAPSPVAADGDTPVACADITHGGGVYDRVVGGKRKAPTYNGTLSFAFELVEASCPGATYTLTVASSDGSPLGWITTSTSPAVATTVSADGSSISVRWVGDGTTSTFSLAGTTSGYAGECVSVAGQTAVSGVALDDAADTACDSGDSGGFNFR